MQRTTTLALLLMVALPATTGASCRAFDATNAGSQAGYNTAKQAADAWSKREDQVSVSLGECLGDISTTITSPVFPSLSGILNKIEQEVCQAAQSEIDQYIPSTIDPWGDMPVPDIPDIPVSATRQPVSSPAPALPPLDEVVPGTPEELDSNKLANAQTPESALQSIIGMHHWTNLLISLDFGTTPSENNNQVNPLLKMKAVGDYTLGTAEVALTVFTAAKTIEGWKNGKSAGAIGVRLFNAFTGAGDIASGFLNAISVPVYFLLLMLFSIGFSLSIFLPFIPFIYWLTACASWFTSVLIGTTAGSLWAWTHIGGEEDKGSRSAYGYIFLVDAAIRPSLMVFGFFFSSLVIVAVGTLLNQLFAPALANVQADSVTGFVSLIGILMIYSRLCTTLASSVFSLQVYMPDYVIAWLGGREAAQLMNGAVESTKNMFLAFGSGASHAPNAKQLVPEEKVSDKDNGFK